MKRKKLTYRDIEDKAESIKKDYDYMDNLPDVAWLWEFVRRTPEYRDVFKNVGKGLPQDEWEESYEKCLELGIETFFGRVTPEIEKKLNKLGFPDYMLKWEDVKGHILPNKYPGWRVVAFKKDNEAVKKNKFCWIPIGSPEEPNLVLGSVNEYTTYEDAVVAFFEIALSCSDSLEDTIFIGVSKTATAKNIDEMAKTIKTLIRKEYPDRNPLKKPRIRDDKWKYYVIVYDLKEEQGLSYSMIGDILQAAYPEIPHYDNDIKRYHFQAVLLIEKHGYKDYLLEPSIAITG